VEILSPNPSLPVTKFPYRIFSHKNGDYVSGRSIPVSGTCDKGGGQILVAVGSNYNILDCPSFGRFNTTVNYTGNGGNIAIGAKPVNATTYNKRVSVYLNPNKVPLTLTSPTTGSSVYGSQITFTGNCDRGDGAVFVALNYDTQNFPCGVDSKYTGTLNYTGTVGNKGFGVKYQADSSYRISGGLNILADKDSTILSVTSPSLNQTLNSRTVNFSGNCDSDKGKVLAVVGYNYSYIPCSTNDTYQGTVEFTGNSGNVGIGVKNSSDSTYLINRNVVFQLEVPEPYISNQINTTITSPTNNQQFIGTRTIPVNGVCNGANGTVTLVLAYELKTVACVNNTFSTTFTYPGAGGNIALALKNSNTGTYFGQTNVLIIPQ
jgi:hypothetical protein